MQVMTLALGIAPTVARDFSVMIQSVGEHHLKALKASPVQNKMPLEEKGSLITVLSGMSAASFTILWMKVKIWLEHHA